MIYDPVDQRILMYGGADWENGYTFFDELWSYEPETNIWTLLETTNNPDPRFNTMLCYLPEKHQLFLYGGMSQQDKTDGTWILDLQTDRWTELHPSNEPSRRSDASIAYDPENDVIVLYSGYLQNDTHTQDTWILDCETLTWSQPETQTAEPDTTTETTSTGIPEYPITTIILAITATIILSKKKSHKIL